MGQRYTSKPIGPKLELVPMCPKCRGKIYWNLYSGAEGAQSFAHCANASYASRLIIDPEDVITCDWHGICKRNKNGTVDIFNTDGSMVPHRVIKHD